MNVDFLSGKNIVFRLDCSPSLGMGHLFRSLPLAITMLDCKANVTFLISPESIPYLAPYIKNIRIDFVSTCDSLFACDVLFVDHYSPGNILDYALFRSSVNVIIHDLLTSLPPGYDILINPSALAPKSPPKSCYFGPSFTQLSGSYSQHRAKWTRSLSDSKILISFGSTDPFGLTNLLLAALNDIPCSNKYTYIVPLLSSAPHLSSLQSQIYEQDLNIQLFVDQSDLSPMYLTSYACIGASGSSSWERACIGLPSAQLPIIDNQLQVHTTLNRLGMIYSLQDSLSIGRSFDRVKLIELFQRLEDVNWVNLLSQRASSMVDGLGCKRIASIASNFLSQK